MGRLNLFFRLKERGTDIRTEITAGTSTFLTMSYIIFVQPAVLSAVGMDFGSVMVATCISSAIGSILMGILANYPIALAPAMGHNFFFAFTVCGAVAVGGMGLSWQQALAANFISGVLLLVLCLVGAVDYIIRAVPNCLRHGIAVGIGLLIALLGLEWGGIVVGAPGTLVGMGRVGSPPALLTIFGTFLIAALMIRKIKGAILAGILVCAALALAFGMAEFKGIAGAPPSIRPTLFQFDFSGLLSHAQFWMVIATFLFLDLFDTIGTLVGVGAKAGLVDREGRMPQGQRAIGADAGATVVGTMLGTSTITSYIESAAGVAAGGRTGLTAMTSGALFLLAVFFAPLAQTIGGGYESAPGVRLYPVIAPALIVVGSLMFSLAREIDWAEPADAFSAYLTIIIIPLTVSITEGIAAGFISYSLLKTVKGDFWKISPLVHVLAALFLLRYAFLMG
ncbi:MAG: NCS2 family permease [Nitrospinota bacterium]|nr:NCS2 family permease [Nitrospinota bacterium]